MGIRVLEIPRMMYIHKIFEIKVVQLNVHRKDKPDVPGGGNLLPIFFDGTPEDGIVVARLLDHCDASRRLVEGAVGGVRVDLSRRITVLRLAEVRIPPIITRPPRHVGSE